MILKHQHIGALKAKGGLGALGKRQDFGAGPHGCAEILSCLGHAMYPSLAPDETDPGDPHWDRNFMVLDIRSRAYPNGFWPDRGDDGQMKDDEEDVL